MGMVHYSEDIDVRKKIVIGYYLLLTLVGFTVLLGSSGSRIPVSLIDGSKRNEHRLATPYFGDEDPASCASCHPNEYSNWSSTDHATHMTDWGDGTIGIGVYFNTTEALFNSSCSECHTTGWDNSTGTPTYDALGVNCHACHDSTGSIDYNGTSCENCHRPSGPDHPNQAGAYQNSGHANSLTDLRASGYASSSCMHCMSTEGFVHPDSYFDPFDDVNPIGCPACHSAHSDWSSSGPNMIRAVNATQLCAFCHIGSNHDTYNIWYGGPHHLAGLECTDCHGYDYAIEGDPGTYFLNHTFAVDPDLACGQSPECHEGMEEWALNQLEEIQNSFDVLVDEVLAEAASLQSIIDSYNQTAGSNKTLVNEIKWRIDDAVEIVEVARDDRSHGFHNPAYLTAEVYSAYTDLLNAKSFFYESLQGETITIIETVIVTENVTITETVTVTETQTITQIITEAFTSLVTIVGDTTLLVIGGSFGGIVIGIVIGILMGRRGSEGSWSYS